MCVGAPLNKIDTRELVPVGGGASRSLQETQLVFFSLASSLL